MTETLSEAVEQAAALIRAWGRPCAVIGGAAMVLRVRARPTRDVDIVMTAGREDLEALLKLARDASWTYADDQQTRELAEEGLVQLYRPGDRRLSFSVDLIFVDGPFLERVVARATQVSVGSTTLPVATVEDLLLLKLEAGRGIDLDDAIAIKDAFEKTLDRAYLEEQARALGVQGSLDNLLGPRPA
jgi:hypothetical protein